tara:strand:- start:1747 stop:2202 length:456 start_codon:yes stop_codon:yes gene_type:complete
MKGFLVAKTNPAQADTIINIHTDDAETIAAHLCLIPHLLAEGYELHDFQIKLLHDLVKELQEAGHYKLPKKRGGQKKSNVFRDQKLTFHVMKLIEGGEKATHAIDSVANLYGIGSETVRRAFYEMKDDLQSFIESYPDYRDLLEKSLKDNN